MDQFSEGILSKCKGGGNRLHIIGGGGGLPIWLVQEGEAVQSIIVYTEHFDDCGTILSGIELAFTNGRNMFVGSRNASMRVTECIFRSGETLPRETILCGNGRGSLSGYFQIGSKLKAGSGSGRDNSKYRFDTTGRILKGLEARAGSNIDAIALIVSKKVKAVNRVKFKSNYGI